MGHHHDHHHHATGNIKAAFFLNLCFAVIELIGGFITNSVAILSDALHDFGDSISLGVAWYLQRKAAKPSDATYTYGYKRFSLLGAFINSVILIAGSVFVIKESIERIADPQEVDAKGMILMAVVGIVFNAAAMFRLRRGSSINEKVVSLHFLEDVLGWAAVLVGALVMLFFHLPVLDPILSLCIASFILFNVYRNLKPALRIVLQGIPNPAMEEEIRSMILKNKDVHDVHDFHLWSLDGAHTVVTMHIVVENMMDIKEAEQIKAVIKKQLRSLHVYHATIEVEFEPEHCGEAPNDQK